MTDPLYIAMCDFGKLGREATVNPEHTRRNVVDMIVSGEWLDVLWVRQMNADGTWSDITADIAEDVFAQLMQRGEGCPAFLRDWIDNQLNAGDADRLSLHLSGFVQDRAHDHRRAPR